MAAQHAASAAHGPMVLRPDLVGVNELGQRIGARRRSGSRAEVVKNLIEPLPPLLACPLFIEALSAVARVADPPYERGQDRYVKHNHSEAVIALVDAIIAGGILEQ